AQEFESHGEIMCRKRSLAFDARRRHLYSFLAKRPRRLARASCKFATPSIAALRAKAGRFEEGGMNGAQGRAAAVVGLMLLAAAGSARAQVSMGEVFGRVTDSTGAVLPGATVTLSGPALIQPQTTITVESGAYRFPRIPIGTYSVTFELAGFKKAV